MPRPTPSPSSSRRIRISSATATVGWVSFSWKVRLLIELADIVMCFFLYFSTACLNTGGNEEILLLQAKLLACIVVVIRVKNLNDSLCQVLLLNRLLIITLVEGIQMEGVDRLCIPDTQGIYYVVAVANDRQIIGYGTYRLISLLDKMVFLRSDRTRRRT